MSLSATADQHRAYEQSRATADAANRCLLAAFSLLGIPRKMLDVGCGPAHMVSLASRIGVNSCGIDIIPPEGWVDVSDHGGPEAFLRPDGGGCPRFALHDLTQPLRNPREYRAGLVLCLEVAEHLPPGAAETLCETLAHCTEPGGMLLFSAATPGQGGAGHINERPHGYWKGELEGLGLRFDLTMTLALGSTWSRVAPGAWWYGKNCMLFHREEG